LGARTTRSLHFRVSDQAHEAMTEIVGFRIVQHWASAKGMHSFGRQKVHLCMELEPSSRIQSTNAVPTPQLVSFYF